MANATWSELMAPHRAEVQALAEGLRQVVRELLPEATEIVRLGWQSASYRCGPKARDEFLAIMPKRDHVNLHLPDGVDLRDPYGLLEGSGKRVRHVKIRGMADLKREGLSELIRQAQAFRDGADPSEAT